MKLQRTLFYIFSLDFTLSAVRPDWIQSSSIRSVALCRVHVAANEVVIHFALPRFNSIVAVHRWHQPKSHRNKLCMRNILVRAI